MFKYCSTCIFGSVGKRTCTFNLVGSNFVINSVGKRTYTNKTISKSKKINTNKKLFSVSSEASARLEYLLQKNNNAIGIYISVKKRGCNGYSYIMDYVYEKPKFCEHIKNNNIDIFIDPLAIMFVVGTKMDFMDNELTSEFIFNNPNAQSYCGCGESFNVKN